MRRTAAVLAVVLLAVGLLLDEARKAREPLEL